MKEIFFIQDNTENKISYYHLLLFLCTLPFDRFYSTIILISFLIHTLIFLKRRRLQQFSWQTLLLQSAFWITLISTLYSSFFRLGIDLVSKQFAIFLVPSLLSVTNFDIQQYRKVLLSGFSLCCCLTIFYLYFDAANVLRFNKLPLSEIFSSAFLNHNFSLPIEMHATYLSMMLVICFVHLCAEYFETISTKRKIFLIAGCLILLAGLIQLGSKAVLLAFLLIINIGFPLFVLTGKKRFSFAIVSVIVSAIIITIILSVHAFRERYVSALKDDLYENPLAAEQYGRLDRWDVALEMIKESPVIGYGSGSEIPLLRERYYGKKMYNAYLYSLNAHNQYLSFLINAGIPGLLLWLATLYWGFRKAIKRKNILLLGFMILIAVVSCSENMLDVNKGIFFYAFFFAFFAFRRDSVNGINVAVEAT